MYTLQEVDECIATTSLKCMSARTRSQEVGGHSQRSGENRCDWQDVVYAVRVPRR